MILKTNHVPELKAEENNLILKEENKEIILRNNSEFTGTNPSDISGCINYWSFDETSGDAIDSVGGFDGTVNGATQGVPGRVNTCYSFDGGDIITAGDVALGTSFSISFWIKTATDYYGDAKQIISKSDAIAGPYPIVLRTYNLYIAGVIDRMQVQALCWNNTTTKTVTSTSLVNLRDGNWHHFLLTKTPTVMAIYTDNKNMISADCTLSGSNDNDDNLTIGAKAGPTVGFTGLIDEVSIFNRILTESEGRELYQNGHAKFADIKNLNSGIILKEVK